MRTPSKSSAAPDVSPYCTPSPVSASTRSSTAAARALGSRSARAEGGAHAAARANAVSDAIRRFCVIAIATWPERDSRG